MMDEDMSMVGVYAVVQDERFWHYLDELVAGSEIVVDRPKGSPHPRYPWVYYPLDYGYLAGTTSGDGSGIDAWLGTAEPKELDAIAVSVDLEKRDAETKLLLGCTFSEKSQVLDFMNTGRMGALLIPRRFGTGWLLSRRSVRRFRPQPVPRELLDQLLQAAAWAPSAHNDQPWRFAVLTADEPKNRLAERMGEAFRKDLCASGIAEAMVEAQVARSRQRILEAPAAIVLCLDTGGIYPPGADRLHHRSQEELLMAVQSVAMAGENLLLAAHSLGLGGVWLCAPLYAPKAVRAALDLPESWLPQGLILVGYPTKTPTPRPRLAMEEIVRYI
jgi:F420 biosynthesis protein FbiB-like protein